MIISLLRVSVVLGVFLLKTKVFGVAERTPEVSIIIPVYNVERYLARALDSAVQQTFRDIEIICVDDGSTDNSLEILREYARRDPRITVLENGTNRGIFHTRTRGILASSGRHILFLDSDDELARDIVERAHVAAAETGVDVVRFAVKCVGRSIPKWVGEKKFSNATEIIPPPAAGAGGHWDLLDENLISAYAGVGGFFRGTLWGYLFTRAPVLWATQLLLHFSETRYLNFFEDNLRFVFILEGSRGSLSIPDVGYFYFTGIGICGDSGKNVLSAALLKSASLSIAMQIALEEIKLGNFEHMALLQRRHPAPLLEYVQTIPVEEGVDLFAKYLSGFPRKKQLAIARETRERFPSWYGVIHRLSKIHRRSLAAAKKQPRCTWRTR
ncbi:MAG: glycosyltransferase family 2 protein [Puniceicoccales bacterium]|jgi:glycosyltransferase involved in cell wall biosynthesis|nr:glycosyltransferase family 2 protein [Puniceicoccales bacterium]